jgi:S1-C subfamily serine protease
VLDSEGTGGQGSGFVVDGNGHIATNAHVVTSGTGSDTKRAKDVFVEFSDGNRVAAEIVGDDPNADVALLKVDPDGLALQPLELGSSSSLDVGEGVAAIGDPFGYERSISTGIVSGVERTIEAPNGFTVAHAIQTDAAVNPGNSGGPLLNAAGEVVGIVDQIATGGSEQSAGVGFAVPIERVTSALAQLKAGEQVHHAYLGVGMSDAATRTAGAAVADVTSGGPAADAGLRAGDVITKIDNTTITDANDLVAAIAAHRPGEDVELTVRRGSDTIELTVTLAEQPQSAAPNG